MRRSAFASACAAAAFAAAMLAACEPPPAPPPETKGAAIVDPPQRQPELPAPVSATVAELGVIAESGSYRDMAKRAALTPGFRSNDAGWSHEEYWYLKLRAGDWPMAQMQKVLTYRYAEVESAEGRVFVWPYMAVLKPAEITRVAARDIDALAGPGQADAMRGGQSWQGYSLGIREDGVWVFFVSGAG